MKYSFLAFSVSLSVTFGAATAAAQKGNASDVTGPPAITIAGGAFTPLPVPNSKGGSGTGGTSGASGGAALHGVVASIGATFSAGTAVISPATGQAIAPAAVETVGALIVSGSMASANSVGSSLQRGGATPLSVGTLMEAMIALSNASPSSVPGAIANAGKAFNALVASAPAGFFRSNGGGPPATFLAIHAALTPMLAAIGH
jgi:hypothetical protein